VAVGGDARKVPDYERIGRFIYAFHRAGVSIDELKGDDIAKHAPRELATRASRLAQKFDFILKAQARVPDAEIDAILRQAADMSASIAAWRRSIGQ
jgi:negative regulator of sigma E activity